LIKVSWLLLKPNADLSCLLLVNWATRIQVLVRAWD